MIHPYGSKIKRQMRRQGVFSPPTPPSPATCFPSREAVSVTSFLGLHPDERTSEQREANVCSYKLLSLFTRGSGSARPPPLTTAASFHLNASRRPTRLPKVLPPWLPWLRGAAAHGWAAGILPSGASARKAACLTPRLSATCVTA